MFIKALKGRALYRVMSICCSLVSICICKPLPLIFNLLTGFYLQSFCMYGYDAGVLGGVQTTKPFLDAMNHPTGIYVIPMIASSYTLAAAVCSLAVTMLGMPLGRRGCILMGDAFVIVGAILQASAWSVPQIIVGRVLCGFGIGFISCSVPTYMVRRKLLKSL
jgi:MFS family permease